jgi:hypothetical protein
VRAAATGRVKVSVVSCSVSRSWYSITPKNNVLTVARGTSAASVTSSAGGGGSGSFTFQPGYYTVLTLRAAAAALLPAWAVTYDRVSNTYTFRPPDDGATYTLAAAGALRLALGLGSGANGGTHAAPIRSVLPSRVSAETSLLVRSSLPMRKGSVADNYARAGTVGGTEMRESDVLLEMPINAPPFDTLSYQNGGGEPQHAFELTTTHLQDLRLWLTDETGAPIEPAFDWSIVLKVTMGAAGTVQDVIARKLDDLLVYVKYAVWSLFPPSDASASGLASD